MSLPTLIVGLGNPGPEHASQRHNVGFMALERLAGSVALAQGWSKKFGGELTQGTQSGRTCWLFRPASYMNDSGQSVGAAAAFFRIAPRELIVLHDELDLPFGQVRLKLGGGHAGHNGLRSVIAHLGTPDFVRVRVGIGRPPPGFAGDVADYVLSGFTAGERSALASILELSADVVVRVLTDGLEPTMNRVNTRPGSDDGPHGQGSADENGGAGIGGARKVTPQGRFTAAAD
jgi:PTH1 family peptidyl-tRNA hydrolase